MEKPFCTSLYFFSIDPAVFEETSKKSDFCLKKKYDMGAQFELVSIYSGILIYLLMVLYYYGTTESKSNFFSLFQLTYLQNQFNIFGLLPYFFSDVCHQCYLH